MTAQELRDLIDKQEKKLAVAASLPEAAKAIIRKQISDMKSQLETLEKAEKEVKTAEKTDDEKKIDKAEQKLEDKEKKAEAKVESADEKIKKTVKKGMSDAQKRAAEKYRQKQKEKKEAERKKKEAAEKKAKATKKKRAKKPTKVEAKSKRKAKPAPAPKKSAPKKSAPKAKRKKRATKKDTISSFLAKNKTARQKYKGVSMESKKRDADVPAKPFGYRLAGTNRRPTKAEIKSGKAYWEGRPTKADVRRTGYPKLAEGGFLDDKIIGSPNDPELLAGGNYFSKGGEILLSNRNSLKEFWSNPSNANKKIYFVEEMESNIHSGDTYYVVGSQTKKDYEDNEYWDFDGYYNHIEDAVNDAKKEANKSNSIYANNIRITKRLKYAKGGGIFGFGGDGRGNRTHHQSGRAWTLDHYQHNKSEDYEKPMRSRVHKKKKYDEGGEIGDQEIGERETTVIDKPQTKSEAKSGKGEAEENSMWLVLLKDKDGDEVFEVVSAEDMEDAYEEAEEHNKGSKAIGIKLLVDKDGKNTMFKRGGKVKGRKLKYTYLPQHEIAYITTWDGVIIDAEDILDGAYIRGRRKFEEGGSVWSGSSEGVEGAGMFAKGGVTKKGDSFWLRKDFYGGRLFETGHPYSDEKKDQEIEEMKSMGYEIVEKGKEIHVLDKGELIYQYIPKYLFAKGGGITENPYKYAKDKAQGLVSKAKEVSGFAKGGVIGDKEYNRITSGEKLDDYFEGIDSNILVEVYKKDGYIYFIKTTNNKPSQFGLKHNPPYNLVKLSQKDAIEKGWMKKGGRVKRSKGNSPSGRAWTLDHYQHNKREDYEVPMRNRKHKK